MGSWEGGAQPSEKKFVRTLVMVDVPVLDKDRSSGGEGVGGIGGGGGSDSGGGSAVCYCDQHPLPLTGPCVVEGAFQRDHRGGEGGGWLNPCKAAA